MLVRIQVRILLRILVRIRARRLVGILVRILLGILVGILVAGRIEGRDRDRQAGWAGGGRGLKGNGETENLEPPERPGGWVASNHQNNENYYYN